MEKGGTFFDIWDEILRDPYVEIKVPYKQLLDITNTRFMEKLDENEINLKNGFSSFVDELKNNFNFKLVLKSEYIESITKYLLRRLTITDLFDLIVFQDYEGYY